MKKHTMLTLSKRKSERTVLSVSDKGKLRSKGYNQSKEAYSIMMEGQLIKKTWRILNVYVHHSRVPKYMTPK